MSQNTVSTASKMFRVTGVNPGNGRVVEIILAARTEDEAKEIAESAGLFYVVVKAATESEARPAKGDS